MGASGEPSFEALVARGERLLEAGAPEEAEAILREAVALQPRSARAHSKLGVALARQGRYEEAVEAFRRALESDPLYAPAYSNLGAVYHELGRLDDALTAYQKAIEVDPDYWIAHQNLAALHKQRGDYGAFVRHMKRATWLAARAREGSHGAGCLPMVLGVALLLAVRR